ncbi:hypothetical protein CNBH1150 [Cryptococcus deneoformans B-3501A]|uniref:hypothetical protein n=1 Tax=Cryptococcus deneoformans (strain B-3501A) TaxID=283643 RepID=UPI000042FB1C|nr:hypothetical protein CNBH1150 [Cryptococcus neoformans var. neoformans B-3501A]EAL19423.1 hypothetical protein CNBH1150 [Cryptococcus neoformans var. neoformans B-3501A]
MSNDRRNGIATRRYLAFGNNLCRQLDYRGSLVLKEPKDITDCLQGWQEVVWHSYACTIAQNSAWEWYGWGLDPLVSRDEPKKLEFDGKQYTRIIGYARPLAFLQVDGHVVNQEGQKSVKVWNDVVVTELGATYGYRWQDGVYYFESLQNLLDHENPFGPLEHSLLHQKTPLKLFATESQVYILAQGAMSHLFEVIDARALPPGLRQTCKDPVTVKLVEDLEGLGVTKLVTGSANRFLALTEGGDAYLLAYNSDPEMIKVPNEEEVRLAGVGPDFVIVVTENNIYVQGSNSFGQLGLLGDNQPEFIKLDIGEFKAEQIEKIYTSRWSTILCVRG